MLERNVLRDYLRGDEVTDEVFQAAASISCDREEIGEAAVVLTAMKQHSEVECPELKREMIAHGYNPEQPKIDSRFLAWMRNR